MKRPGPSRGRVLAVSTVGLALTGFTGVAFATSIRCPVAARDQALAVAAMHLSETPQSAVRSPATASERLVYISFIIEH